MKLLKFPLNFYIAIRYFKSVNKKAFLRFINFISVIGVAIGVTTLIVVLSVMNGFDSYLKSKIIGATSHITIKPTFGKYFFLSDEVLKKIKSNKNVVDISPIIIENILIKSMYSSTPAIIRGVIPEKEKKVTDIFKSIIKGKQNFKKNVKGVFLGKFLAQNLNVKINDYITIIPAKLTVSPLGIIPSAYKIKVKGIFKTGIYDYDNSFAYIPLNYLQQIFRVKNKVTNIEAKVNDIDNADKIANELNKILPKMYYAYSWIQLNFNFFGALKLEKLVMFIILTLIIAVAALNIASSIVVLIVEKTKEIGILRALGLPKKTIQSIFLLKGFFIGGLGSALGFVLGMTINFIISKYEISMPSDVYYIERLPVKTDCFDVILICFTAIVICVIASYYPSKKASSLKPVEAIRNE